MQTASLFFTLVDKPGPSPSPKTSQSQIKKREKEIGLSQKSYGPKKISGAHLTKNLCRVANFNKNLTAYNLGQNGQN